MKRAHCLLGIVMVVGILAIGCSESETTTTTAPPAPEATAPVLAAQTACPISGTPIDKTKFVDYEGQRIYFCCDNCPNAFNNNPEEVITKLKTEGIELEKAPS